LDFNVGEGDAVWERDAKGCAEFEICLRELAVNGFKDDGGQEKLSGEE
jgi:hypothetical protein